eukprot:TRINITY_DN1560_c0_g1_i12.p1 TRINITY_DN1560_c0_g1~~TRINITY_DN1560_c0_g1_i12.p1  ORF type:complete len:267 (-),score=130.32 TRINITY_DN1560_c0_g1_i12:17-817(-)
MSSSIPYIITAAIADDKQSREKWLDETEDYGLDFFKKSKKKETLEIQQTTTPTTTISTTSTSTTSTTTTSLNFADDLNNEQKNQLGEFKFTAFNKEIILQQNPREGCGGYVWRAAYVLSKYCENEQIFAHNFWSQKRVIELGSGTGLVGIAIAAQGGHVIVSDLPVMLPLLTTNVELNRHATPNIQIAQISWGETDCKSFNPPFDFIIAADCVYLEHCFDPLIATLLQLSDNNTKILLAYEKRRKADKRFFTKAKKKFTWNEVKLF